MDNICLKKFKFIKKYSLKNLLCYAPETNICQLYVNCNLKKKIILKRKGESYMEKSKQKKKNGPQFYFQLC